MENGQGRGVNRISEPRVVFIDFQPIAVFVFYGSFMVVDDPCLSLPEKKTSSTWKNSDSETTCDTMITCLH